MADIAEMLRTDIGAENAKREKNRREFPGVSRIVDEFAAAFGPVKVLHAIENGREIGKRIEFDGVDVDKLIRLDDMGRKNNRRSA